MSSVSQVNHRTNWASFQKQVIIFLNLHTNFHILFLAFDCIPGLLCSDLREALGPQTKVALEGTKELSEGPCNGNV